MLRIIFFFFWHHHFNLHLSRNKKEITNKNLKLFEISDPTVLILLMLENNHSGKSLHCYGTMQAKDVK